MKSLKELPEREKLGLSAEFITKYFDAVHMESINHQKKDLRLRIALTFIQNLLQYFCYTGIIW